MNQRPPRYMDFGQYFDLNADKQKELEDNALQKFQASQAAAEEGLRASQKMGGLSGDPTKSKEWDDYTKMKTQSEQDLQNLRLSQTQGDPRLKALRGSLGLGGQPVSEQGLQNKYGQLETEAKKQSTAAYGQYQGRREAEAKAAADAAAKRQAEMNGAVGYKGSTRGKAMEAEKRWNDLQRMNADPSAIAAAYRDFMAAREADAPQTI